MRARPHSDEAQEREDMVMVTMVCVGGGSLHLGIYPIVTVYKGVGGRRLHLSHRVGGTSIRRSYNVLSTVQRQFNEPFIPDPADSKYPVASIVTQHSIRHA
jgi:hypothetical protein